MKYSEWLESVDEIRVCSERSFRALFDSRYRGLPNFVMKSFLEAYAKATSETKNEDRFPNLKEIQAKMKTGEVYNAKRRFMRETEFFREIHRSEGVSLYPVAKVFVDASNQYTPLIFDFEKGEVIFPKRREGAQPPSQQQIFLGPSWIYYALLLSTLSNIFLAIVLIFVIIRI